MTDLYAFTYKINDMKDPSEQDYKDRILKPLMKKFPIIDYVFERDSKQRLHVHGVIDFFGKIPRFTTVVPKGVHSHHVKITTLSDWQRYILKEQRQRINNQVYMF